MQRARLRDLGITVGRYPTGKYNAITDVPGVLVGHSTVIYDMPRVARTGVTAIIPRHGAIWKNHAFAAYYAFNGNGELTGAHWIDEAGMLTSPIGLTNTHQVGVVRDMLIAWEREHYAREGMLLPVVAETFDGWLNDIDAFHITKSDLFIAMNRASSGPLQEGNVGGGTGMICHDFKGRDRHLVPAGRDGRPDVHRRRAGADQLWGSQLFAGERGAGRRRDRP